MQFLLGQAISASIWGEIVTSTYNKKKCNIFKETCVALVTQYRDGFLHVAVSFWEFIGVKLATDSKNI